MAGEQDVFGIVNWIEQFLEEFSHHPVPAEFKISFLKRSYCTWNDDSLTSIYPFSPQIAAQIQILEYMRSSENIDIPSMTTLANELERKINDNQGRFSYEQLLIDFHAAYDNLERNKDSMSLYLDTNVWTRVREKLESSNLIICYGHFRGRTYRHKSTRPRVTTGNIADLIAQILDKTRVEMSWSDIFPPLKELLKQIHTYAEKLDLDDQLQNQNRDLKGYYILIPTRIESKFHDMEIVIDNLAFENFFDHVGDFPSDLNLWIESAYTSHWFGENATQIKRYFNRKNENVLRGSLRGRWRSPKTELSKSQKKSELYKSLAKLSEDVEKLSRKYNRSEDRVALRQALEFQLEQLYDD